MNINIIPSSNFELSNAISDYANLKLSQVSKHLGNNINSNLNVEIGKTNAHHKHGNHYLVKCHLRYGSRDIHIEGLKDDIYASIDDAKDKLLNELTEKKDKSRSLSLRLARKFKNIIKFKN
jgi:ribosomal subunit interface protein